MNTGRAAQKCGPQTVVRAFDKLSIPDIEICCSQSDVQITKCVFILDDWTNTTSNNCTDFIQHSRIKDNIYCYLFETNNTYFFGNPDSGNNLTRPWVRNIDFYFKIDNITNITSKYISVGAISVQLMDPNFNPLWKEKAASIADLYENQTIKSQINAFAGIQNMTTLAYFTKQTIQTILPHDIFAIFGTTPNYHNISYLNVISKYFPLHPNEDVSAGNFHGHFNVGPGSFIHDVQSEKLSHTVLFALGLFGGGFGLISGIYILLFGQLRNNP
ncbi:27008_t:CDS:2, partial [Dentiscutata erythropus]